MYDSLKGHFNSRRTSNLQDFIKWTIGSTWSHRLQTHEDRKINHWQSTITTVISIVQENRGRRTLKNSLKWIIRSTTDIGLKVFCRPTPHMNDYTRDIVSKLKVNPWKVSLSIYVWAIGPDRQTNREIDRQTDRQMDR